MVDKTYNILWIDDKHEKLTGTKGRAKRHGITLIPFKSLNGGMDELERNYPFYDGVLLDAKFLENEDDPEDSEDTDYVHRAKERLLQLKKKFEIFVLTGQAEVYEDKTFQKAFTKVYKKGSDEEIERLISDIKTAAATQEDTQIRHKYNRVFAVCSDRYLGSETSLSLLYLLKTIEGESDDQNTEDRLNAIRKIIEKLFVSFNKIGVLPNDVLKGHAHITNSSKFLAGSHNSYELFKPILHPTAAYILRSILSITQDGSHSEGDLNLRVDEFIKSQNTSYLFRSTIFQLLDLLIWFKDFVDDNPDIERNKTLSSLKQHYTGLNYIDEIKQDDMNNYHCGEYLLNYKYVSENFKVGQKIQIIEYSENSISRTKELYPKFAIKFKLI